MNVTEDKRVHVLSVPREALHIDGVNKYVFRIENGRLVRTPVTTGIISVTDVEIVSGLSEGQLVVLGAKVFRRRIDQRNGSQTGSMTIRSTHRLVLRIAGPLLVTPALLGFAAAAHGQVSLGTAVDLSISEQPEE